VSTIEIYVQQLINGFVLGSFYALVALGYSMVYGIVKLLNFAHGDIFMTGAFVCLSVFGVISAFMPSVWGLVLAIAAAMTAAAVLGYVVQRLAYMPLLGDNLPKEFWTVFIGAVGVVLFSFFSWVKADITYNALGFNPFDMWNKAVLFMPCFVLLLISLIKYQSKRRALFAYLGFGSAVLTSAAFIVTAMCMPSTGNDGLFGGLTAFPFLTLIFSLFSLVFLVRSPKILSRFSFQSAVKKSEAAPRLSLLITAIGVSLIINNAMMVISKSKPFFFNSGLNTSAGIKFGEVKITFIQIVLVSVTAALMLVLTLFIGKTMRGKAMRAVALDKDTCRLMGINVNKIIGITFIIGSALAAIAGGMYCISYGNVTYTMGYMFGIKAFTSAVLGGIGSIPGAMLGGILLGLLEAGGTQILTDMGQQGSAWKDVFAFGILIVILILRPNGLLGRTEIERM